MTDNYRIERISRLFDELRYEIERGMMEGEIDESLSYLFFVPTSKTLPEGVVRCFFQSRPVPHYLADHRQPRLQIIKGGRG